MTHPVALHRITTQYVAEEDRLRLSALDEQDHIHLYWLTQRLANQLVNHLGGVLAKHTETADVFGEGQANESSSSKASNRQTGQCAHDSATSSQAAQTPVMPTEATQAWLLQAIDISAGDHGLRLTFKVDREHRPAASLTLAYSDLRQWMHIVYQQYVLGDWNMLAWTSVKLSQRGTASTSAHRPAHALH